MQESSLYTSAFLQSLATAAQRVARVILPGPGASSVRQASFWGFGSAENQMKAQKFAGAHLAFQNLLLLGYEL